MLGVLAWLAAGQLTNAEAKLRSSFGNCFDPQFGLSFARCCEDKDPACFASRHAETGLYTVNNEFACCAQKRAAREYLADVGPPPAEVAADVALPAPGECELVFLDLGSNYGDATLTLLAALPDNGKELWIQDDRLFPLSQWFIDHQLWPKISAGFGLCVVMVEPHPKFAASLQRLAAELRRTRVHSVQFVRAAAGARNGTVPFTLCEMDFMSSVQPPEKCVGRTEVTVPVLDVPQLLEDLAGRTPYVVVAADVEGSEFELLEAARARGTWAALAAAGTKAYAGVEWHPPGGSTPALEEEYERTLLPGVGHFPTDNHFSAWSRGAFGGQFHNVSPEEARRLGG